MYGKTFFRVAGNKILAIPELYDPINMPHIVNIEGRNYKIDSITDEICEESKNSGKSFYICRIINLNL